MSHRRLALLALVVLFALAGCSGLLGPSGSDDALAENASYDWDVGANATFDLETGTYTAIYRIENRSEFAIYDRDALGQERAVTISALQFRYANGTELSPANSSLTAERGGGATTITFPANVTGHVAFESPRRGKTFTVPTHVEGRYTVTLPRGGRVGVPILSDVTPSGASTAVEDDRVTLDWEDVETDQVRVRWYLQRDLLIFSSLVAILFVLGSGGVLFFYRQIKRLRARREEVGLDVDADDDDPRDRGPPPGMR